MKIQSTPFTLTCKGYSESFYGLRSFKVPNIISAYFSKKQKDAGKYWTTVIPIGDAKYRNHKPTKCGFARPNEKTFIVLNDYGMEYVFKSKDPSFIDYLYKIFKEEKTEVIPELLVNNRF